METRSTTGIPKIDEELEERLKLPERKVPRVLELDDDFPGCNVRDENHEMVTIHTVGAGWNLVQSATAVAAAGAKMIAYDMNKEKIGLGQVGLTVKNTMFDPVDVRSLCEIMPTFTWQQLERLPPIITKITQHQAYKDLMEKSDAAKKFISRTGGDAKEMRQKYFSDNKIEKLSKKELISAKNTIIDLLKEEGVLQIVHQEITIDDVQSRLENHEPVLIMTGNQVNLKKMGLEHLDNTPGFLKEFLPGSPETDHLVGMVLEMQNAYKNGQRSTPPSVAFIGGGASSFTCAKDLLEKVRPELLQVVHIRPEEKKVDWSQKVKKAEGEMKYEWISGYISEVKISQSARRIERIQFVEYGHGKRENDFPCDLLVHSRDHALYTEGSMIGDAKSVAITQVMNQVTHLLDEKNPKNGLVRFEMYLDSKVLNPLMVRIIEPWTVSLEDDEILKNEIRKLVELQKTKEEVTFVVTGGGDLVEAVKLLAASLGYRGRFIQIALPIRDAQETLSEKQLSEVKHRDNWLDVEGRLVQDGTAFQNGKFSLGVCNEKGKKVEEVPAVDAIINAAGKVRRGPLVEALLEKGYLRRTDHDALEPTVPTLSAHLSISKGSYQHLKPKIDTPSKTYHPRKTVGFPCTPFGWKKVFDFAREMSRRNPELQTHN